jgi:hypothetical protein
MMRDPENFLLNSRFWKGFKGHGLKSAEEHSYAVG